MRRQLAVLRHMLALSWRADSRSVLVIFLLVLFNSAAIAVTGLSQKWLVDSAFHEASVGIAAATAVGALAYCAMAAGSRIELNLQVVLCDRVDVRVSEEVLTTVTALDTIAHLEHPDYLNRLSMLRSGTKALSVAWWSVGQAASAVVSLVLSLWLLMRVHPALGLLILVTVPSLWTARQGWKLIRRARRTRSEFERAEKGLHDLCVTPESLKELEVCGSGHVVDARAASVWDRALRVSGRAEYQAVLWQLAGWLFFVCGFVAAISLVTWQIQHGRATVGELVMVISLGSSMRLQLRYAVQTFGWVSEAEQFTRQYLWLADYARTDAPVATSTAPDRLAQGITLENVSFAYPGSESPALQDVNLTLAGGTTVALVGSNGAGKSTLVNLLTGTYRPTAGTVAVDGTDLRDIDLAEWRSRSTGAFQDFVKFELPVREAIGIGRLDLDAAERDEEVRAAATRAEAADFVGRLPQGYDTQLGHAHAGVDLSHGQWQRLALARAFLRDDAVLTVLDEPTAALDPQAENDLYEQFTRRTRSREGCVNVLVSHRFSTVRLADQIVVVADGRVVESGSHDDLMTRGGRYAELYTLQASGFDGA
ncbi:ABC transporter ATP-binding protein [Streptomyces sp. NPDC048514]|uniref:ABC transporter ATP-binding protein n=1 Tax=Streptomyces sp. NPDC048514 TaxID=3365564 RepID=UPI00371ACD71